MEQRSDMKRSKWSETVAVLIAALVWAMAPAPAARAEVGDSSIGAGITLGLLAAVVVVYGLVSLRSDVERYSEAGTEDAIVRAAKLAEESPIVLQAVTAPIGLSTSGGEGQAEIAGAAIGWRVSF
jgi:hypothetical protein